MVAWLPSGWTKFMCEQFCLGRFKFESDVKPKESNDSSLCQNRIAQTIAQMRQAISRGPSGNVCTDEIRELECKMYTCTKHVYKLFGFYINNV